MDKKVAGYRLFGFMFTMFRLFPVDRNKVFLIATHDDSLEGNVMVAASAIKKARPSMRFISLTKKDNPWKFFSYFVKKTYHMATSKTIILDNVFMPMAYTPISKKTVVIQLWHGTGTIKRFGLDVEKGSVARIAKKGNKRITWLIVNGERSKRQYASAFGVDESRIRTLGLPRTDLLLDQTFMESRKRRFLRQLGDHYDLSDKRFVLYAPTFRDGIREDHGIRLDINRLLGVLDDDVVLLLRAHPAVSESFSKEWVKTSVSPGVRDTVIDVSDYPGVTTLLSVADVLITDYSSIIFEYALLKKPMIFYAYDLDEFKRRGRGFYEDYEKNVPGPVVRDEDELCKAVSDALKRSGTGKESEARIEAFLRDNYRRMDGRAAERVAALALREKFSRQS